MQYNYVIWWELQDSEESSNVSSWCLWRGYLASLHPRRDKDELLTQLGTFPTLQTTRTPLEFTSYRGAVGENIHFWSSDKKTQLFSRVDWSDWEIQGWKYKEPSSFFTIWSWHWPQQLHKKSWKHQLQTTHRKTDRQKLEEPFEESKPYLEV